jgi:hypothetical protein
MTACLAILSGGQQYFKDQSILISVALSSLSYNSKYIFGGWVYSTTFQKEWSGWLTWGIFRSQDCSGKNHTPPHLMGIDLFSWYLEVKMVRRKYSLRHVPWMRPLFIFTCCFFIIGRGQCLGLHLPGRCSTTWTTPPAHLYFYTTYTNVFYEEN